jgi:hypothetical protein
MAYGISCWPNGDRSGCRNTFDGRPDEEERSVQHRAGKAGWVIGHWDGQGQICCPDHAETGVWDATPLNFDADDSPAAPPPKA